MSEGLFGVNQLKVMDRVIAYNKQKRIKPEGIQRHHLISAMFYIKDIKVQYTEDIIRNWDEFDSAVMNFNFVNKYIRLPRI